MYVDYSKAFDTLDNVILCTKLETFGLSKNVVNWCRNYLQSREQMVKIAEHLSEPANVTFGVPHGSILTVFPRDRYLRCSPGIDTWTFVLYNVCE